MINKRILSTLLALAILLSCVGWTPAQAQGTAPVDAETPADQTSISTLPIEEEEDELPEREPIARLYGEEGDDLNKIVYLNNDGTRTMHLYDYPVKYRDASGEIHDISLEIADGTTELNRFQSSANSIMTAFPSKASDGISLSGEGVSIKLIPNIPEADTNTIHMTGNAKRIDSKTISYDYDAKTTIEYSLTYTGFKEDIVVSEYTGQTEYEFLLQTNGLALTQIDGSFYLTDESGKIKAAIGDVIVFTADEKNNTMGTMEAETLKENHSYLLTIVLDAQYLANPNTAYPIRIDPTIDINYDANGSGAIEDVTIYSNVTPDGASTSLFVGLRETRGISRILMRFPNLDLSGLTGATVESAEVTLRDLICEGTYLPVYCYPFTGANWTESTASWSMTQNWGPELDNQVISYSNGVNKNPKHRYSFNITAAVQGWINGTYSKAKGLIFKTSNEVETAATYEQRQFASYNRTNYRPTFSMTYALGGTITAANNAVVKGNTMQLTAHVNGTVTWKSSDPNIATITSNGLVTGVQAGKVTITATHPNYDIDPFTLWVTLSNGVYYIKNASSGLCLQGTAGQIHINSQITSQDTRLNQLWKIFHIGSGRYVIRPMQNLSRALTVDNGGYVAVADAADIDADTTSAFHWSISYNASGYAVQQYSYSSKTVTPVVANMPNSMVYTTTWSNSATCHWEIDSAQGVFVRDAVTLEALTSSSTRYLELGVNTTLSDLGLKYEVFGGATNLLISSSSSTVASIHAGTIVPNNIGLTTITVIATIGSASYSQSFRLFTIIPNGTYYICNKGLLEYVQIDQNASSPYSGGEKIEVTGLDEADDQKWVLTHIGSGYYSISSKASQLALTVPDDCWDTANARLVQATYDGKESQKWKIQVASTGAYIIRPKSCEDWCIAAVPPLESVDGCDVEQRAYVSDISYLDEWYVLAPINVGLSTDDYDSGECVNPHLYSYLYGNTFYDTLSLPKSKTHNYNYGTTHNASPQDFLPNGAISQDIDFMMYIGHGHPAMSDDGNHLHYDCGIFESTHGCCFSKEVGNLYHTDVKFGSADSKLRWAFLYTCNFLAINEFVTENSLKAMMNGAHIVIGFGSKVNLNNRIVTYLSEQLTNDIPIIDATIATCNAVERLFADGTHILRYIYLEPARYETIYSPYATYSNADIIVGQYSYIGLGLS